jgi:hypothetical protein
MTNHITLGTTTLEVAPIPLGRLKKLLPAFNRAGRALQAGLLDEAVFDDIAIVLSAGTGLDVESIESLPATMAQLSTALEVVAQVAGLEGKTGASGAPQGEGPSQAVATPGTSSTPGSSPPPAGPGSTSTSA